MKKIVLLIMVIISHISFGQISSDSVVVGIHKKGAGLYMVGGGGISSGSGGTSLPDDTSAGNGDVLTTDGNGTFTWEDLDTKYVRADGGISQTITGNKEFTNGLGNELDINASSSVTVTGYGGNGDTVFKSILQTNNTGFLAQRTVSATGTLPFALADENSSYLFQVNHDGDIIAESFIKNGATSDDILLGDGTTAEIIDDDTFTTATSQNIPSAESVKAYVDAEISGTGSVPSDSGASDGDVLTTDGNGTYTWEPIPGGGGVSLPLDAADIADGSVSNTEFQYLANLSADIQQQIDSKLNNNGGVMAGNLGFLGLYGITDLVDPVDPQDAATKAYVDANAGVQGTISGRTGTDVTNVMLQTQSQYDSDGAPSTGEVIFISDASPAEVVTSATVEMEGWKMYDDTSTDAATITLSDCDPGETLTVYINRASAPTLAGTGITFNQLPNTTAFAGATDMAIIFEVTTLTDSGDTVIDYYYVER